MKKSSNRFLWGALLVLLMTSLASCCKKKKNTERKNATFVEAGYQEDLSSKTFAMTTEEAPDLEKFSFVEEDTENSSRYLTEAEIDLDKSDLEEADELEESNPELYLTESDKVNFDKIQFPFNSNKPFDNQIKITKENINKAKKVVTEGDNVSIIGHCCQMGAADFNMALSLQRANAIKRKMISQGIPEEKIIVVGAGQENPLVSSDVENRSTKIKELSPNRRVEIYAVESRTA